MRLPAGRSSTSMPASSSSPSGSVRRRRPSPPGNSVDATSAKFDSTAAYVSAKRRSTVSVSSRRSLSSSARLSSRSAVCVRSSDSCAFSRSYSSFANGLTPPSVSRRRSSRSRVASSSSRVPSAASSPASARRRRASVDSASSRASSISTCETGRRRLLGLAPHLGLTGGELPQPGGERRGDSAAGLGALGERPLDALRPRGPCARARRRAARRGT